MTADIDFGKLEPFGVIAGEFNSTTSGWRDNLIAMMRLDEVEE